MDTLEFDAAILQNEDMDATYVEVSFDIRALLDRKSTRLNSSHNVASRMPSSA